MSIQQSDVLYTAVATAENGRVATDDGKLDLVVNPPKELFAAGGDGFGIIVEISAHIPNVDAETAGVLIKKAHQVCPYSKATRGNITVTLV
jgi:osmotically inducible protein OsmC